VFEMGTGMAPPVLPPGKKYLRSAMFVHTENRSSTKSSRGTERCDAEQSTELLGKIEVVKPHDRLVLVSSMHCCTSTSSLSTM
jgi:hypothetical protein